MSEKLIIKSVGEIESTRPPGATPLSGKPLIFLFANKTPDSQTAFNLLKGTEVTFKTISAPDKKVVEAEWSEHAFIGVPEIESLSRGIVAFRAALFSAPTIHTHFRLHQVDPELRDRMKAVNDFYITEGEEILTRLNIQNSLE